MSKPSKGNDNFAFADFDTEVKNQNIQFDDLDGMMDLSEVPERAKYEAVPPGIYDASIDSVELGVSQRSGNPMLTWTFRVELPNGRNRTMFYHTVLRDSGLNKLKRLIVRLSPYTNEPVDLAKFKPSEASLYFTGTQCRVRLRTQPYEGELRNSVSDVLAPEGSNSFA
jgi:hypothetical protein